MDPRRNPYAPGAGTPPPELAGRDDIIERAAIALDRIRAGRAARSLLLHGLRGVGKAVLLNRIRTDAEARGFVTVAVEVPEERSLPGLLVPPLRAALLRLSRGEVVRQKLGRSLRALGSFVSAMKLKYADVELAVDLEREQGLADSGDLEADLADLFMVIGSAAKDHSTALVLFLDELQYISQAELAALLAGLHRVGQSELPLTMLAAGLPQVLGLTGRAKSYAERLFEFVSIDRLSDDAAKIALSIPVEREDVRYTENAIAKVIEETKSYPYFLQEWGKHCWDTADASPISSRDVRRATIAASADLDAGFFRVRFDRLTPAEKRYLRAMADLGAGPQRSGDIADRLGQKVTTAAPVRSALIAKGMIYSPAHGDTAFTVPLFDGFLKRTLPPPQRQ